MATKIDKAWAAGLFEGEGTVTAVSPSTSGMAKHRYRAAIIMTDEDVLRRFADIVQIGKLYGPYQPTNQTAKLVWRWTTTKNSEVKDLFNIIGPWMGRRRTERFLHAIADDADNPTLKHFHKLSDEDYETIRRRYSAGGISQTELGLEFGITQSMVSTICKKTG